MAITDGGASLDSAWKILPEDIALYSDIWLLVAGRALKSVTWLGSGKDKKEQVSCSLGLVTTRQTQYVLETLRFFKNNNFASL